MGAAARQIAAFVIVHRINKREASGTAVVRQRGGACGRRLAFSQKAMRSISNVSPRFRSKLVF
jgi:hypothetical protein